VLVDREGAACEVVAVVGCDQVDASVGKGPLDDPLDAGPVPARLEVHPALAVPPLDVAGPGPPVGVHELPMLEGVRQPRVGGDNQLAAGLGPADPGLSIQDGRDGVLRRRRRRGDGPIGCR
jgi:hypothetical protein